MVKTPLQGAQVQSLVRELGSPCGAWGKKIKKKKKAEFLLKEKEMSPAELDPTHTNSAILSKERESLILNTEHLNILKNQCSAWLLCTVGAAPSSPSLSPAPTLSPHCQWSPLSHSIICHQRAQRRNGRALQCPPQSWIHTQSPRLNPVPLGNQPPCCPSHLSPSHS